MIHSASKLPIVSVNSLKVTLSGVSILSNVNLTLYPGEIVTIIGPNGAGKSTLIKTVVGLIKPFAGEVRLANGTKIGYMPQSLNVPWSMPITVKRFLTIQKNQPIKTIMQELDILDLMNNPMQKLSGGELQRVMLARALLHEPQLLVLDEPAQGVDVTGQVELYQLIKKIRQTRQCAILLVSHDLHLVMAGTDTVICLNKHICCSGHPEEVSQHPEFIHLFGSEISKNLAIYSHHHNHQHQLDGQINHDQLA